MLTQDTLTIIGGLSVVLINSTFFGIWVGKLSSQVESNKVDIQGVADKNKEDLKNLKEETKENIEDAKKEIDIIINAKQEVWEANIEGFLNEHRLRNLQDTKEHGDILKSMEKYDKRLEDIQNCLFKMQQKKDC